MNRDIQAATKVARIVFKRIVLIVYIIVNVIKISPTKVGKKNQTAKTLIVKNMKNA
jgi:hypothetical protein